jgi:tRNA pseudouridine55 synthase
MAALHGDWKIVATIDNHHGKWDQAIKQIEQTKFELYNLAADVGEALGCGGHVEALVRTRVGSLRLEDAVPWAAIQAGDAAVLAAGVLPPDRAVDHLPTVQVSEESGRRLGHGQRVPLSELHAAGTPASGLACRVYAGSSFLGIGEVSPEGLRPLRLLHADRSRDRSVSP